MKYFLIRLFIVPLLYILWLLGALTVVLPILYYAITGDVWFDLTFAIDDFGTE